MSPPKKLKLLILIDTNSFFIPKNITELRTDAEKQMERTLVAMEKLLNYRRILFNIHILWQEILSIDQSKNLDGAVGSICGTTTTIFCVGN